MESYISHSRFELDRGVPINRAFSYISALLKWREKIALAAQAFFFFARIIITGVQSGFSYMH